ncbi:hypothetical protein [Streptomyces sp900116325]|uniref:hypothetical protein n=1 Tax=Streptomyces sp. 900116325 TaxID=3154295 RepID=UPI0033E075DC
MIARPARTIPVPDAVASLAGRQLPAHVQSALGEVGLAGRLLTGRTLATVPASIRTEPTVRLHVRLCAANKVLAAHNPGLIHGWADLDWRNQ